MYKIQPKTLFTGKKIKYLSTCHSTNDIAVEMIQSEAVSEGTVVITDKQTAGRGQRGNTWLATEKQNLTFSLIWKPTFLKASQQFQLNVAISLGVFDFLREYIDEGLAVKWSNDLYFWNQKMGGILIENTLQGYSIEYSVIGIGLNINQLEFNLPTATSLRKVTGNPQQYDLSDCLCKLLEHLEKNYVLLKEGYYETLKARYLTHLFRYQEWHEYRIDGHIQLGQILGIDEHGRLALETSDGLNYYGFKEIEFII